MKSINMTEDQIAQMKPSATGTVKSLFDGEDDEAEKANKKLSKVDAFEVQKDIIHYVEMNEMLTAWLAT